MPPKAQHDREKIVENALAIAREQGLGALSARALADRLGCSTSPIYTAFANMHELEDLICERSTRIMLEYQSQPRTGSPLLDLCLGYVLFAVAEKQLFRDMFLDRPALSAHSLAMRDLALQELLEKVVSREPALARLDQTARQELLETLWTYSHGLAAQYCVGALDPPATPLITARLRRVIDPLLACLPGRLEDGGETPFL
ncbi:MAG: TetR/AcrR family transcriptional regulator [Deltaproteobacteria bacterium]|nr:TetR/AcrR family transcriptional regulator [Deltaproteobacteria bacterium]